MQLSRIINADQSNTDRECYPNGITVGEDRVATTARRQDNRAASTSDHRASHTRAAAPYNRSTAASRDNKRLLSAQQRRHVLPAR